MRRTYIAILFLGLCYAQQQAPATADELKYLRFMLLNIASIDHDPKAIKAYEDNLVKLHGLSAQESATIHSLGVTLNLLLAQNRKIAQGIVANKQSLSDSDKDALAQLDAEREQKIMDLANQLLNSVSAATAARLRAPGHILAGAVKQN